MKEVLHSESLRGHTINIVNSEGYNPREDDNLGKMACFHGRYKLGDKTDISSDDFNGWDEMREHIEKKVNAVVILPLYLYDHSGITMNTTGFSCRWDSGQVGFIYATKKDIRENFMVKNVTKRLIKRTEEILKDEIKTYDLFLTGQCYGFEIIKDDTKENIFSCGGYLCEKFDEIVKEAKCYIP
jgi:hypothetical protein